MNRLKKDEHPNLEERAVIMYGGDPAIITQVVKDKFGFVIRLDLLVWRDENAIEICSWSDPIDIVYVVEEDTKESFRCTIADLCLKIGQGYENVFVGDVQ